MPFNKYNNPLTGLRLQGMAQQPVNKSPFGNPGLFNPAASGGENPYGGLQQKRLFSGIVPGQGASTTPSPKMMRGGTSNYQDNSFEQSQSFYDKLRSFSDSSQRPARTAYETAVQDSPEAEEYAPSKWRRLAAAVGGGLGGFAAGPAQGLGVAENINTAPYRTALDSYEQRIQGLGQAAELEASDSQSAREDFIAATNYAETISNRNFDRAHKGRELDLKEDSEWNDYQNQLADIQYKISMAADAKERTRLIRMGHEITQKYNDARIGIQQGQLGVQQGNLGVARERLGLEGRRTAATESQAASAATRASREPRMRPIMPPDDAFDLALRQMYNDPKYRDMIDMDQEFGDFSVKPGAFAGRVHKEALRIAAKLAGVPEAYFTDQVGGAESADESDDDDWDIGEPRQY